ncbi:hypothetical protein DFA_05653 [Cavenderia fasciculata]|uniref:Transmembrane protein n=1 Tax=Cavenderia fasciculata TaxID=261658 RepID=F4PLW6_CACFS|nr:uncharacterized protein DFA_05653 [Cavenderia fasciculata]EGG23520.1 hypothetical protein DFA_05653 [Cavenderia fasciculata]|eukprot:XP_004361371.1 hypothetical protein DFA_05653 [Cavenderia fasciculata]
MDLKHQQEYLHRAIKSLPKFVGDQFNQLSTTHKLIIGSAALGWSFYSASKLVETEGFEGPLDDVVSEFIETLKKLDKETRDDFDLSKMLNPNQYSEQIPWMAGMMKRDKRLCQAMNDQFDMICTLFILLQGRIYEVYQFAINGEPLEAENIEYSYTNLGLSSPILQGLFLILESLLEFDETNFCKFAERGSNIGVYHMAYTFADLIAKMLILWPNRTYNLECMLNIFAILVSIKVNSASTDIIDLVLLKVSNQLVGLLEFDPEYKSLMNHIKPFSGFHITKIIPIPFYLQKTRKVFGALSASLLCYYGWLTPAYYIVNETFLYTILSSIFPSRKVSHKNRFLKFLTDLTPIIPFIPLDMNSIKESIIKRALVDLPLLASNSVDHFNQLGLIPRVAIGAVICRWGVSGFSEAYKFNKITNERVIQYKEWLAAIYEDDFGKDQTNAGLKMTEIAREMKKSEELTIRMLDQLPLVIMIACKFVFEIFGKYQDTAIALKEDQRMAVHSAYLKQRSNPLFYKCFVILGTFLAIGDKKLRMIALGEAIDLAYGTSGLHLRFSLLYEICKSIGDHSIDDIPMDRYLKLASLLSTSTVPQKDTIRMMSNAIDFAKAQLLIAITKNLSSIKFLFEKEKEELLMLYVASHRQNANPFFGYPLVKWLPEFIVYKKEYYLVKGALLSIGLCTGFTSIGIQAGVDAFYRSLKLDSRQAKKTESRLARSLLAFAPAIPFGGLCLFASTTNNWKAVGLSFMISLAANIVQELVISELAKRRYDEYVVLYCADVKNYPERKKKQQEIEKEEAIKLNQQTVPASQDEQEQAVEQRSNKEKDDQQQPSENRQEVQEELNNIGQEEKEEEGINNQQQQ